MWILYLALLAQSANLLDDGNKALDAKQYDRALELFNQAAAADPKDYAAHFQLALAYSLLGRDGDAIPQYKTALELHPGLYEAQLNLGLSLLRTNHPAEAAEQFRAATEQRPTEFRPALGLAQALYNTDRFPEAEAAYRKAVALDARSAAAESGLAMSLIRQKLADDAATHVQQAFVLDRSYRAGFIALAELYESTGRVAEAIPLYHLFPDNPEALERLSLLQAASGNLAEAIPALETLMEKMPTGARRMALAKAYVENKQLDKAEALLQPAVQATPADFDLRLFYGRVLRDQRKFPEAAAEFSAAARIDPKSVVALNELASALVIAEEYPQALAAFDRIRALSAEIPGNYFFRALAHDRLHQRPEALENYNKFLATSGGKFPDQEFQARQRARLLEKELRRSGK
jgi:tetratricopeptide (TPR) repeat protein